MDSFLTISSPSEGIYKDKGSRFLAFAFSVDTVDEAMAHITQLRKQYHDARHVCWAYRIDEQQWRVNDDGEPSGTAGRPIFSQIQSKNLYHILIIVVRYFGGILLGTGGLTVAYREATKQALDSANILTRDVMVRKTISFPFEKMNEVMRTLKQAEAQIVSQQFDNQCVIVFDIKQQYADRI